MLKYLNTYPCAVKSYEFEYILKEKQKIKTGKIYFQGFPRFLKTFIRNYLLNSLLMLSYVQAWMKWIISCCVIVGMATINTLR